MFKNFKSKNFSHTFWIIVVVFTALLIFSFTFENLFPEIINFFTKSIRQTFYGISTNIQKISTNFKENNELIGEIETLKKINQDLRNLIIDYYDLKKENELLTKSFELKEKDKNLTFVGASIVSCSAAENFYSFIINKGKNSGISVNDTVITENGLVGKISSVASASSRVTTILSPDFKICGVDKISGDVGIINGNIELCIQNSVKMSLIPAQNEIKENDLIVTAGYSGIYPKNLKIGEVLSIEYDFIENSKVAIIKLFENVKNIKDVFVITDFCGKGEFLKYSYS